VYRVLVVDDHELMRAGLRLLVESCLGHAVTEASSAGEALEIVRDDPPDVVFLDVRMPGLDGLWLLDRLRDEHPQVPVLMLSTLDEGEHIQSALTRGAAGYVLKEASVQQVSEAIETAIEGRGVYLHPVAAQRLLDARRNKSIEQLTERERDVLTMLVKGAKNEEIANSLFVTEKTVKTHLSAIFRKLGVSNRTQAATRAIREGLATNVD
jgi:DNA-binding NarL/FixJ family response regulator